MTPTKCHSRNTKIDRDTKNVSDFQRLLAGEDEYMGYSGFGDSENT